MEVLGEPMVVSIGLDVFAPAATTRKLQEYGWQRDVRHAVVLLAAELRSLWDGLVLVLR